MTRASSEEILQVVARAAAEAIREADITDGDLECAENALRDTGLGELIELAQYLVKRQKEDRNVTYVLAVQMAAAALAKLKGSR